MIIYIYNNWPCHYEIIISIIEKYDKILSIEKDNNNVIYLSYIKNDSFTKYIKEIYTNIILNIHESGTCSYFEQIQEKYDYFIDCSTYEYKDGYSTNIIDDNKHFYIAHDISDNLLKKNNVYYLTPLCNNNKYIYCDILPYQNNKIKSLIPIYIIQGNIEKERRNYELLLKILDYKYNYKYKIKIIGRGKLPDSFNKYSDIIDCKYNCDFINYHKQFLDCYCIIPLITKESHPQYYTNKLTSTINYGKAYDLKFLIDQDLQDIYKLENVEIYTDNIIDAFNKTLEDFYKKLQESYKLDDDKFKTMIENSYNNKKKSLFKRK
jgi:hypothetical protein